MTGIVTKCGPVVKIDNFTHAYLTAALWSSNDESNERGGDPLDKNYTLEDIHPNTLELVVTDCQKFQAENADLITKENHTANVTDTVDGYAGHDFWLTRQYHGVGFWDGDWEAEAGQRLTEAAHKFPECSLYVGDDGYIHL